MTPENTEIQKPEVPKFFVKNRSRAQKLAKLLFGPQGRAWKNASYLETVDLDLPKFETREGGVAVGAAQSQCEGVYRAATYTEALRQPVEKYLLAATDYKDAKKRLLQVGNLATVDEFADAALAQRFPAEYKAEQEQLAKRKAVMEELRAALTGGKRRLRRFTEANA